MFRFIEEQNKSAIYKFRGDFSWDGVSIERYKQDEGNWANIARQAIVGERGESALFHLRYFEIAPGGYSSLEKHLHEHVVIAIRGKGKVILGTDSHELKFLDVVYISPETPHQLVNDGDEPFGFFCIVNAGRDGPIELSNSS